MKKIIFAMAVLFSNFAFADLASSDACVSALLKLRENTMFAKAKYTKLEAVQLCSGSLDYGVTDSCFELASKAKERSIGPGSKDKFSRSEALQLCSGGQSFENVNSCFDGAMALKEDTVAARNPKYTKAEAIILCSKVNNGISN